MYAFTKVAPYIPRGAKSIVYISGPPRVKLSPISKVLHCAFIGLVSTAYPVYILANLKNYRGKDE